VTFFLWKDEYNITVVFRGNLKQRRIGTGSFFQEPARRVSLKK
jgi:hypothetical protein